MLFSSALYVLNHLYRLDQGPLEWARLFCFGLPYAAALWQSGALFATVGLHWGWNLAGAVLPVEAAVRVGWAAPLLSAGAHLLLLCLVLAAPGSRHGRSRRRSPLQRTPLRCDEPVEGVALDDPSA